MIRPFKKFKLLKTENAQTMVEFALVFPFILLITYGIIEFGRMVFIYASVTNSAREGARYGTATQVGKYGYVQYADCEGIKDAVRTTAFLIEIPDSSITIFYQLGPGTSFATPCATVQGDPDSVSLGDRIKVNVSVQYEPMIGGFLGVHGFTIKSANARTIMKEVEIGN